MLPDDAILACDVGVNHNWYMQFWKARRPQTMLNSWGFSGMGFGAAGALGAKLAAPDRPVVAIAGDGCFTMVPHVLCTAVEYNIPVVWVIWNNFAWASIRDIQYGMFGGRELGTAFYQGANQTPYNPDFAAWARASGVEGVTVTKSQDFKGALEHAVKSNKPYLLDVHVDANVRPPATGAWQLPPTPVQRAGVRQALGAGPTWCRRSRRRRSQMPTERKWFIRNIAEVPWRNSRSFGGALSKPLVMPETAGSQHIDYRISMYQPMAYVKLHRHKVQEQVYHVLEGEGLMEIDGEKHVVRKHDFIFLPPGVEHSINNTGLVDLVFLVVTSPVTDDLP